MTEYKVVPVEPSEEMLSAVTTSKYPPLREEAMKLAKDDYKNMLAASPDTGMVAVPRELLEGLLANDGGDGRYSLTEWNMARKEIRTILEASQ